MRVKVKVAEVKYCNRISTKVYCIYVPARMSGCIHLFNLYMLHTQ